jgi:hypothetical protein
MSTIEALRIIQRRSRVRAPFLPTNLDGAVLWLRADLGIMMSGALASLTAPSSFDNAAWTKTRTTVVANDILSGVATADRILETTQTTQSYEVSQTPANWRTGLTTISVRAKRDPLEDLNFLYILTSQSTVRVFYNLLTGTVGAITQIAESAGCVISTSMALDGDGFYLCTLTYEHRYAATPSPVYFGLARTNDVTIYTVVTPRSIWLYDAQVSQPDSGVSAWADQSGNANDFAQATVLDQGSMTTMANGQPSVLLIARNSEYLSRVGFTQSAANNYTVCAVLDQRVLLAANNQYLMGAGSAAAVGIKLYDGSAGPGIFDGSSHRTVGTSTLGEQCLTWQLNATAGKLAMRRNGVSLGTDADYDATFNLNGSVVTHVGSWSTPGVQTPTTELAELIVYDRVLAANELAQVESYLMSRYAL